MNSGVLTKRMVQNLDVGVLGSLFMLENGFDPELKLHQVTWSRHKAILRAAGIDAGELLAKARRG